MASATWQEQLERATTERDVIAIARDFVATFTHHDIAALPEKCRPGKFFVAEDITSYAFDVVRHQCDDELQTRELVHRLAAFFSHASSRLSQLMAGANAADDERQSA